MVQCNVVRMNKVMNYVNIMSNLNHNRNSIIVYELSTMGHDINGLKQKPVTSARCDDISMALGRDGAEKADLLL
jgi:hypothetical protein